MKIYIRQIAILLVVTAALLAVGCGQSNDRFSGERSEDVTSEGIFLCYQCHNDIDNPAKFELVFGNSPAAIGWLNSPHANNETFSFVTFTESDMSPDNVGFPYFGYEGLGQSPDCTTKCHDQVGNGRLINEFAAKTGDATLGRVDRPVIGCESCHGSGNGHMSVAKPGPSECGQCHSAEFDHNVYHPEGDNIVEYYRSSPHAKSPNVNGTNICSRCHTNEGAQAYIGIVNGTEDPSEISATLNSRRNFGGPSAVQCATCHDGHTLELLGEKSNAGDGTWSGQFKTCTSCHQLYDETGALHAPFHNGWAPDVLITDTHYDDPSDSAIQGYIINATLSHDATAGNSNGGVCPDCHNPHNADNTINRQWASSSHGGFILETADPIDGTGNVTEVEAPAFVHYDFKASNRQGCQRCHTSTGFRNLANDPAAYDADGDGNPDTPNQFTATGEQREMLYCWACHTDNVGGFRNPGIFNTTISLYNTPAARIAAVGDLGGSNICMACHSGRESGEGIKEAGPFPISQHFGSFNSHYLAAGGVLFRTIGYEFSNTVDGSPLNYDDVSFFHHDEIGTLTYPETGNNGPCVGCHMEDSDVGHTLEVVKKDSGGIIVSLPANDEICSNCHRVTQFRDSTLTPEIVEHAAEGYHDALDALEQTLSNAGIYFGTSYPYFFNSPSIQDSSTRYTEWQTEADMGAAFNLNMLHHEPGAFAHNSFYTKRLIFDAIDWLDGDTVGSDGEFMDGSIDLSAFPDAAEWYQEDGGDTSDDSAVARP